MGKALDGKSRGHGSYMLATDLTMQQSYQRILLQGMNLYDTVTTTTSRECYRLRAVANMYEDFNTAHDIVPTYVPS